jgi:hypothetical protein
MIVECIVIVQEMDAQMYIPYMAFKEFVSGFHERKHLFKLHHAL